MERAGRFAAVTPPAMTLLLGTSLGSRAIAGSAGLPHHHPGPKPPHPKPKPPHPKSRRPKPKPHQSKPKSKPKSKPEPSRKGGVGVH
ncbi:hypothetical protein [Amaricoccus solimangrovi]|nr:hypothetical protein [Amaricoccus solimangrovi]